jgi:cystathionine beta-lyase
MGAVITRQRALNDLIAMSHMRLGMGVSPDDAYLVMRGLPTMKMRFEAHDAGARKVAQWLKGRPEIARVLHPACEDCPGHEFWKRDFSGAGGLFSVLFDASYDEAQTDRFVDSLELFGLGYSWGGANSLVMPYRIAGMRRHWPDGGVLVRLNIGLEDTGDLIADLEQALGKL